MLENWIIAVDSSKKLSVPFSAFVGKLRISSSRHYSTTVSVATSRKNLIKKNNRETRKRLRVRANWNQVDCSYLVVKALPTISVLRVSESSFLSRNSVLYAVTFFQGSVVHCDRSTRIPFSDWLHYSLSIL